MSKLWSKCFHIDNGGYTFSIESAENSGLTMEEGFFGYAHSTMTFCHMTPERLRELGGALIVAASKLEEEWGKDES